MSIESFRSYLALCDKKNSERVFCDIYASSSEKMHRTLKDFKAELRRVGWIIRRDGTSICPTCASTPTGAS